MLWEFKTHCLEQNKFEHMFVQAYGPTANGAPHITQFTVESCASQNPFFLFVANL